MGAKKHRIQVDFTNQAVEELESLKKKSGAPSRAETIRYAIRVLKWVLEETEKNNKILVEESEDKEIREVCFPFI